MEACTIALGTIKDYMGTGFVTVLFLVALVYLAVFEKDRIKRIFFVYIPFVIVLVFLCPVSYKIYGLFSEGVTYYRLLWLLPMGVCIAYAGCKLFAEHKRIGLIVISAHTNYNTFETTVTGNMNGLPLATINGYKNPELRHFHEGKIIQPAKTVIIGARNIDDGEKDNIRYSGVTMFTTKDIKEKGIEQVMEEAFQIAGYKTKGIHISFDLDIIDPDVSPGVSVPEFDGLSEEETMKINEILIKNMKQILSYELVEFNPLRDINRKTEQIALNLLAQIITAAEAKKKWEQTTYY